MNSLTITLYVLTKVIVRILAETEKLSIIMAPSTAPHISKILPTPILNQYYVSTTAVPTTVSAVVDTTSRTTTTTTPRVTTLRYYPRTSNSLYSYKYNTDTGIQAQEDGHLNNAGTDQKARGSYSYTDNDGNTFQVSYIANENGFQPEGAHLPRVPPRIKKVLQYIAEHPEENEE